MKDIVRSMQVDLGFDGVMVFTYKKSDDGKVRLASAFIDSGAANAMVAEVERIYQTDLRKLVGELKQGIPECVHCGSRDVSNEHWSTCPEHPARKLVGELCDALEGIPDAETGLLDSLQWTLDNLHKTWGTSGWKESDPDMDTAQNNLGSAKTLITNARQRIGVKS